MEEESYKITGRATGPTRKLDNLGGSCQPDQLVWVGEWWFLAHDPSADSPIDPQAPEEMGQFFQLSSEVWEK